MAEGDGGVALEQKMEQWQPHQSTSACNHHLFPLDVDIVLIQYLEDCGGSARQHLHAGVLDNLGAVGESQAVDIFDGVYQLNEFFGVGFEEGLEWQLQQYPRYVGLFVQLSDQVAHFFEALPGRGQQVDLLYVHVVLCPDLFEFVVVLVLCGVVLQKLMHLEPNAQTGGQVDFFLDVGEGGRVEAHIDDMQFWGGVLWVLVVEVGILLQFCLYFSA